MLKNPRIRRPLAILLMILGAAFDAAPVNTP